MAETLLVNRQYNIVKIIGIYALFGFLWIYTSDTVLGLLVHDPRITTQIAIFKGSAFIILTSLLLYILIKLYDKKTVNSERAVIASEKRFEQLFQKVADPIYIADTTGKIIAANDQACRELGRTLEEILQLQLSEVDASEYANDIFAAKLPLLVNKSITFETTHRRKDGTEFPVELNVCLIDIAGKQSVMGVARNISKRKRTENCLAFLAQTAPAPTEEDFFHRLTRYLASSLEMDYICIDILEPGRLSAKTIAVFVDGKFEDNISYTLKDTPCGEVVNNSVCCYAEGVRHHFPGDAILQDMKAESYVGAILWGTNGKQIGLIAAIGRKPLGDREQAEEILQLVSVRAAAELERNIYNAERLHLEKQILHAQKLESLGVLAGGIAHDFNNILLAIMGNADLALMRINKESPVVENLHRIEQAAAKAADLAKQMLAYSGKGKFVIEDIDLNHLVNDMLYMLQVSISKTAVLRLNLHQSLPSVEADITQLRQIIMNLVINASEALENRSGVIAITTGCMDCNNSYLENVWLDENLCEGLYVYLEIADTGCGMSKDTMTRLFDPFFTTKFTGRGLGMAAVLGIVRGHKGAVKVYSEPGKGSTFKILFPASGKPAEIFNHDFLNDNWKGSGNVLLVDDEETVRGIGAEMLKELGFDVVTANDGREAIEAYKAGTDFSFVILDLTMPHVDGEQCFRELRMLNPDVKVIMSSGFSELEVTQKFAGKGLAGFIPKPYKFSVLRESIMGLYPENKSTND